MFLEVGDRMSTEEAKMMTAEEKFVFDLQGCIVIKNILTTEEVAEINEISDHVFPRDYGDEESVKKTGGLCRADNVPNGPRFVSDWSTI